MRLLILSFLIVLVRSEFGDIVNEEEPLAASDTYMIQNSENSVNGVKPIETYQPHFVRVTRRRRVNGTFVEPKVLVDRRSNSRGSLLNFIIYYFVVLCTILMKVNVGKAWRKPLGLEDLRAPGIEQPVPSGEYGPPYENPTTQTQPPSTTTKTTTAKVTTTEKIATSTKPAENATWSLDKNLKGIRFSLSHHHHHHKRNNESAKTTTSKTTTTSQAPPTVPVSFINIKPHHHHHHHHRLSKEVKNATSIGGANFNVTFLHYPNANTTQSPNIFSGFLTVAKEATTLITEAFNSIAKVFIQPNNSHAKRHS